MTDKNGIEIQTGDIVEITGAYFKNDNGLYFVDNSPGDPSWSGSDYCLKKISKGGKISKAKRNICFWPISVYVSNREKCYEANRWNEEHATIEIKSIENMDEVAQHFMDEASSIEQHITRAVWDFGGDSSTVAKYKAIMEHYEAVVRKING